MAMTGLGTPKRRPSAPIVSGSWLGFREDDVEASVVPDGFDREADAVGDAAKYQFVRPVVVRKGHARVSEPFSIRSLDHRLRPRLISLQPDKVGIGTACEVQAYLAG